MTCAQDALQLTLPPARRPRGAARCLTRRDAGIDTVEVAQLGLVPFAAKARSSSTRHGISAVGQSRQRCKTSVHEVRRPLSKLGGPWPSRSLRIALPPSRPFDRDRTDRSRRRTFRAPPTLRRRRAPRARTRGHRLEAREEVEGHRRLRLTDRAGRHPRAIKTVAASMSIRRLGLERGLARAAGALR